MKQCSNCGEEMRKLEDKGDKLHRYHCKTCRRFVTTTAEPGIAPERVRAQHGLGMKRTKWF